eukprot:Gb_20656 [translate_table: standard]
MHYFLQLVSELLVEDLGELVYAWELPGVVGNSCNGLTPTVALQLVAVVYGANLFFEPLEDLNTAWLLECLRTLVEGLALSVEDHILLQTLGLQSCEMFEGEEQWLTLVESEVFEGILRFDGRKLEEVSRHHQVQPTEVA